MNRFPPPYSHPKRSELTARKDGGEGDASSILVRPLRVQCSFILACARTVLQPLPRLLSGHNWPQQTGKQSKTGSINLESSTAYSETKEKEKRKEIKTPPMLSSFA